MGWYTATLKRLGMSRWFAFVGSRTLHRIDRAAHRITQGRRLFTPRRIPTLLLTSIGSRTGEPRTVTSPLIHIATDGGFAVAATNWGRNNHSAWSSNLLADPVCRVERDGVTLQCVARQVAASEAAELWPRFEAVWPAFAEYRRRSNRDVRMFLLQPDAEC